MSLLKEEATLSSLAKFWISKPGKRISFAKMPLALPSKPDLLFAAILRSDEERIKNFAPSEMPASELESVVRAITTTRFATMVFDTLSENGSISQFPHTFRQELSRMSYRESATRFRADQLFAKFLDVTANYGNDILILKGAGLSRTAYTRPAYRNYSDLDILIRANRTAEVVTALESIGFKRLNIPSDCNQVGAGPIAQVTDLLLSPHPLFVPAALTSLMKENWPVIDVKISPIDRGIQLRNIEQFFDTCVEANFQGRKFFVPDAVSHLMVSLHTLAKDGFDNWRTLYDIHVLCRILNQSPSEWERFTMLCHSESLTSIAWGGLTLSKALLESEIPIEVVDSLAPASTVSHFYAFTRPAKFIWNSTSMPAMLVNALTSRDAGRRVSTLIRSLIPNKDFLMNYYNGGKPLSPVRSCITLLIHWLVLLFPGGVVRNTFGKSMWL